MFEIIGLLLGLVVDTFIVTSVNGCTVNENIKTFLGIETVFSIFGVAIGSFVLLYLSAIDFKFICGILIILIQIIGIMGVNPSPNTDSRMKVLYNGISKGIKSLSRPQRNDLNRNEIMGSQGRLHQNRLQSSGSYYSSSDRKKMMKSKK